MVLENNSVGNAYDRTIIEPFCRGELSQKAIIISLDLLKRQQKIPLYRWTWISSPWH
jgi:hypothetical protein